MKYGKLLGLLVLLVVINCSSSKSSGPPKSQGSLVDMLTDFTIAINQNEYQRALNFLVSDEKASLLEADQAVSDKVKKQLQALAGTDVQRLIKNPRIKLIGGKLSGIASSLPSLEHVGPEPIPGEEGEVNPMGGEEGSGVESGGESAVPAEADEGTGEFSRDEDLDEPSEPEE